MSGEHRKVAWGLALMAGAAFSLTQIFPSGDDPPTTEANHTRVRPPPKTPPEVEEPHPPGQIYRRTGARFVLPRPVIVGGGALPEGGRAVGVVFSPDTIMDAMSEVTPDITDCVTDWQEVLDVELNGRLTMELTLGPGGVIDAALVDVDGVSEPMLGCFGGVVYEAEWPLPEQVTDMAWPFVLTSG